jgi:mortality factor 4-like protein 1
LVQYKYQENQKIEGTETNYCKKAHGSLSTVKILVNMADPTEGRGIDHLQTNGKHRPKGDNRVASARKRRLAEISNVTDDDYGSSPTLKSSLPDIEHNMSQESTDAGEEMISAFQPNDRCFAGSGETDYVYLATIKQFAQLSYSDEIEGPRWKYLVHFNGWNSRYDQWITEEKVFPDNEHYRAMAEKSHEQLQEKQNRKDKKSQAEKEKKRNVERRQSYGSTSQKEESLKKKSGRPPKMKECCELPITLKLVLVEEQSFINRLGKTSVFTGFDRVSAEDLVPARKIHDLPATIPVQRILKKFAKSTIKSKKHAQAIDEAATSKTVDYESLQKRYTDFASHLSSLFDSILPKFLLYEFEREQYLSLCKINNNNKNNNGPEADGAATESETSMSNVYSGEFLLRMIVRLPFILSSMEATTKVNKSGSLANENADTTTQNDFFADWNAKYVEEGEEVAEIFNELVVFLQKNRDQIFKGKYRECQVDEFTSNESKFATKLGIKKA